MFRRSTNFTVFALVLVAGISSMAAIAQCDGRWLTTTAHAGLLGNSEVHVMTTWDPDGSGPERRWLVVAGELSQTVGDERVQAIVAWDGVVWRSLGTTPRQVNALVVMNNELYAGIEYFERGDQPASTVLRWTGAEWVTLGALNHSTTSLAVYNNQLYAGGYFTVADGQPIAYLARWTGAGWQSIPGGGPDGRVLTMTSLNGSLFVGGEFAHTGSVSAANIARFDGTGWGALGSGVNNVVMDSTIFQGDLVVCGHFGQAGGQSALRIARWTGSEWLPIGGGMNHRVWCVRGVVNRLFAGGQFTSAGGQPANFVAEWDGTSWKPLGSGTDGIVAALVYYENTLVVGGYFNTAGGLQTRAIAGWNTADNDWDTLDAGFREGTVAALNVYDGKIHAGGSFNGVDGGRINSLAAWNGHGWQEVTRGVTYNGYSGSVDTLRSITRTGTPPRTYEIVGGRFDRVGGEPGEYFSIEANSIALYTNDFGAPHWSTLGNGFPGYHVFAVTEFNGQIVVGGQYLNADSEYSPFIARWDGAAWLPLGAGVGGNGSSQIVASLAVYNGELIAAGRFDLAGGIPANNIARWNGATWRSLGEGLNVPSGSAFVGALSVYHNELIAGGNFLTAGGADAACIAKWNGAIWQPLGTGVSGGYLGPIVYCMAEYNGDLIAGGHFDVAGDTPAENIARWDGTQWRQLGAGVSGRRNSAVRALVQNHGELYVAGYFTRSGALAAGNWARWTDTNVPWIAFQPESQSISCGNTAGFSITAALGYEDVSYEWHKDGIALVDGVTSAGATISGSNSPRLTISHAGRLSAGQYDVVISNDCGEIASVVATLTVTGCPALGDLNCDSRVNNFDIDAFVLALSDPAAFATIYPDCDAGSADANSDGLINNFDINQFITCLANGGC